MSYEGVQEVQIPLAYDGDAGTIQLERVEERLQGAREQENPRLVTNRYRPERERLCEAFMRGDVDVMADAGQKLRDLLSEEKPRPVTKKWGTRR